MSTPTRRDQILATARALFTRRGYDGTPVALIAQQSGTSKASITYYFPAKEEMLAALLDPFVDELRAVIDAAGGGVEWPEGARALTREYLRVLATHGDLARWVDTDLALRHDGRPGVAVRELNRRLAELVAQASTIQEDQMRALAAVGGIWRPLLLESSEAVLRHLDEIVDAALVSYAPLDASHRHQG